MSEELILSPADPAWHERRREVYTASDMGVLFGLPGFGGRTLSDVWYEKRFGLKEDKGTPSTRLGQRMEPLILDEAETELGVRIIDRQRWLCDGQIGATLDGRCEDTGNPVEAKTAGLLWKADSEWGDEGDEVPSAIVLQVQAQILVTDSDRAHVAALIGGRGFKLYTVPRHDGLILDMQRRAAEFLCSLDLDNPPAEPPQLETLKRLKRQPNKVLPWSSEFDDLHREWTEAKANSKAADEHKEALQRRLLAMMRDCDAAECSDGLVTYYEQTNRYPAKLASESTFRVLRLAKGK